jgi:catechol 2,3-dioxygenase-like lactoylglutathione lyase family enzyme
VTDPVLHHAGVGVADLQRSLSFYEDVLGLGRGLAWSAPPSVAAAAFLDAGPGRTVELLQGVAAPGSMHLALEVDDVDAAWARALARGARGVASPRSVTRIEQPDGALVTVRLAFLAGPDGEAIELLERRGAP